MESDRLLDFVLKTPPVEWDDCANRWISGSNGGYDYFPGVTRRGTMDEAIQDLDAMIQRLAMMRGYLDMRYGYGCGDQGHASAVKESNRLVNKIRKTLGFTYAKQETRF